MRAIDEVIQDRFWDLIEAHGSSRTTLRAALDALDARDLLAFAGHVVVARNTVRDRARGPIVEGVRLTPVTTEDLTEWIVGRGRDFWARARGADDLRLAALYTEYLDASTPQILGEAFFSYAERFGDDMNEALDAYLSER